MRLVLVGAGEIASTIVACAAVHGHRLVAAVDTDPRKAGRELGGVAVTQRLDDVSEPADLAIVATGSSLAAVAADLRECMRRGYDVVSTCEELVYPWRTHPEQARDLDAEARACGVTLIGAGVNPGFVMDALVLAASVPCWQVRRVRALRVLDAAARRPSFQRKVGVGAAKADVLAALEAQEPIGHAGLGESAWMLADRLGLAADELERTVEVVDGPGGVVRGLRQRASLHGPAGEVVRLEMEMVAGAEQPRDEIEVDADPPVRLAVAGGLPGDAGTAGVVVNVARRVVDARSGLLTIDQLALPHARTPVGTAAVVP